MRYWKKPKLISKGTITADYVWYKNCVSQKKMKRDCWTKEVNWYLNVYLLTDISCVIYLPKLRPFTYSLFRLTELFFVWMLYVLTYHGTMAQVVFV